MALFKTATISSPKAIALEQIGAYSRTEKLASSTNGLSHSFFDPGQDSQAFLRLSYDPREDVVILTNGLDVHPNYVVFNTATGTDLVAGAFRHPWTHTILDAVTLDPAAYSLRAKGFTGYHMPVSGCAAGFCVDPITGKLYQQWWHHVREGNRYADPEFPFAYGSQPIPVMMERATIATNTAQYFFEGVVLEAIRLVGATATAYGPGYLGFSPGVFRMPAGGCIMNDVGFFAHAQVVNGGFTWISCRLLPGDGSDVEVWRGSRSMPFGNPLAMAPMSIDKIIVVWWAHSGSTPPLVYTIFRYDRTQQRMFLDDVGTIPTAHQYIWPWHVGYATYDMKRSQLVLLSPDLTDFDLYQDDKLRIPRRVATLAQPVPLSPYHAEYRQEFAALTHTDATVRDLNEIVITYNPELTLNTEATTIGRTVTTLGTIGTGTFKLSWTSMASGYSGTQMLLAVAASYALSATYASGVKYGAEAVSLVVSTQTFTVSQTVATTQAQQIATTTIAITPRLAAGEKDAVGHGPNRLLSYPTNSLASPILYELNPKQWTNMGATAFVRPLYTSKRTLTKTATVQFVGHTTDLEITETWIGGGNRVAMSLSFFAALWDYYANVPDVTNDGFITWEPRDVSLKKYQVFITGLEVGGSEIVTLDNLYKVEPAWIHESVTLKMRLIAEV